MDQTCVVDMIDGSARDDFIDAGAGDDIQTGGAGDEVFVEQESDGADTITDSAATQKALVARDLKNAQLLLQSWG